MDGLAEWQLMETAAVQLVHDSERGGRALVTLAVDDLDAITAELSGRGLAVGDVIQGVVARVASITDPDGNVITLAQLHGAD